jgi:DNA-binding transcriptional LysR family regulator
MTTFRELEALVAVVDSGSFERAAQNLETSQSAVSRLIKEFEGRFETALFNRDQRATRLTMEGQEVLRLARTILRHRASLLDRFASPDLVAPTLRLGVTELAATTWLPRFVSRLKDRWPRMRIELEIDSSPALHARLRDGQLDVAIVIDVVRSTDMARLPVGSAQFGWYCAPRLAVPSRLTPRELEHQTLLIQGPQTGAGVVMAAWLAQHGLRPGSVIHSDSLAALSGIAAAGLGIANLPRSIVAEPLRRGVLREVTLSVPSPASTYIALVRIDAISGFHRGVVELAQQSCDFDSAFHDNALVESC